MILKRTKRTEKIEIDLSGPDGNAFALLGHAANYCRQLKDCDPKKYDKKRISKEMLSGDYEHLITTFDKYFGDYVDLIRQ